MSRAAQPAAEVVISDPRAIRALAHPARLQVLAALFSGAQLTATQCSTLVGLSPSAMSYHLRALHRWGLIEPAAEQPSARERPWRARGGRLRIESAHPQATVSAEQALLQALLDADRDAALHALARETDPAWRSATTVDRAHVWLTAEEATQLAALVGEQLRRYTRRRPHPPGTRAVQVSWILTPLTDQTTQDTATPPPSP